MPLPEPWLRGPIPDVHPYLAPVLRSFEQACEDIEKHSAGLTPEQTWARPQCLAPLGFHLRHIAGSIDRLSTYAKGEQLTPAQFAALEHEMTPDGSLAELLADIVRVTREATAWIRGLDPTKLDEPRTVGRKQLPTTLAGLLIHIAEHTQRHVGQAIVVAKLARATSED